MVVFKLRILGCGGLWSDTCLVSVAVVVQLGNAAIELRAQVEMMVLSADGKNGMRTCVLRPSNMFGPGDSSLVRFVAGYARSSLGKVLQTQLVACFLFASLIAWSISY